MVIRIMPIPMAMATTNTVFNMPINGRLVMAFAGLNHRGSIISSNPKMLPNRKPKIVEKKPQQERIAARFIFLNR